MADDTQEKTLAATSQRLKKAREKGQVASSQDFVSAAVILGVALWAILRGPGLTQMLAANIGAAIDTASHPDTQIDRALLHSILTSIAFEVGGLIGAGALSGIVANVAHKGGLVISFTPIAPDFSRLDLAKGFGRMFERRQLISFGVGLTQLLIWFGVVGLIGWSLLPRLVNAAFCGVTCVVETGTEALWWLGIAGLVGIVIAGLIDLPTQLALFAREMRMSPQEMKQELRETEGSPEMEGHRRELHRAAARAGSNKPTLVISGASMAVALRYDPETAPVPLIVAKGEGGAASRIITAAERLAIPIFIDPPLSRRLLESCRIGQDLPAQEFNAVAPHIVRSIEQKASR